MTTKKLENDIRVNTSELKLLVYENRRPLKFIKRIKVKMSQEVSTFCFRTEHNWLL